ncbi:MULTISPECIES: pseudouridine synthase [Niastella]|uniref:Pseudouridine synthase n=1 Tax=Niastella soli TaxID=2821487 RepID=A0ABS3YRH1_9BACT|nr:pseudouridine synthase [Niastella soli]MBO9200439.1 pseudouridine synthase [Niastella soli]
MAQGFKKFMGNGDSGAKKKERIRQEKKKVRQETKEYFEKKKQEAREARAQGQAGGFQSERGRKDFKNKTQDTRQQGQVSSFKPKEEGRKPKTESFKPHGKATSFKPQAASNTGRKASTSSSNEGGRGEAKNFKPKAEGRTPEALGFKPKATGKASGFKPQAASNTGKAAGSKPVFIKGKAQKEETQPETDNQQAPKGSMPLNKFIAHSGICSRRDAADLVKSGKVIVNGAKVVEPGHKVSDKDDIKVNGKKLFIRRNLVYILLNKPKDFLTTTEDPQGRKTVMDILRNATEERVYPIGRLDRNTTGVLLLTNDGELAQKLSHPSYEIKKIYEVKLDKPLIKKDFDTILSGITLEDGFVSPDSLAYADSKDKSVIGIEIHSGRNRIVRRIFEHLGYDVRNLDRVMYANLTKKNVDRGKWRFLTEKEVRLLKYLNASYTKNKNATRG